MMTVGHIGSACCGKTHASSVMPVVSRRRAASATVTQLVDELLNFSALPNLPVVQVGLVIVPVRLFPDASAVVFPVPSSKPQAAIGRGDAGALLTVTCTAALVAEWFAAS